MKIFLLILALNLSPCRTEKETAQSKEIYRVVDTVLDEYQGLDFVFCSKALDYTDNSIVTNSKPLKEALDIDLITNFQKWTPTGGAIPIEDLLQNDDLDFMKSQITSGFEWQKKKIAVKVETCEDHSYDIVLKFSQPLFNEEKNLSLFFIEQSSVADYSMSLVLVRKKNDNWKRLWTLSM